MAAEPTLIRRAPFVWCAALAVTSAVVGAQWDISWHRSIGRDTFWTPAHMAIYLCGVLAGAASAWLILGSTFGRRSISSGSDAVTMWGFRGPLGAFLAAWGGVAMLTSAPFDDWWHNTYGLDVKILSPPHTLLALGIAAIIVGALVLAASERNLAASDGNLEAARRRLDLVVLYIGGLMLTMSMTFLMEETSRTSMHNARFYCVLSIPVPMILSGLARASGRRFAMTAVAGVYTLVMLGLVWILPLFPAEPKLGPVYQPVHCFIPPQFPLLLMAPALALDLLRPRTSRLAPWPRAAVEAAVFVSVLLAVQWPFAIFLMSKASMNRVFGTMYFDFSTPSQSYQVRRLFRPNESGLSARTITMGLALLLSLLGTRLGLAWGAAMARIRR